MRSPPRARMRRTASLARRACCRESAACSRRSTSSVSSLGTPISSVTWQPWQCGRSRSVASKSCGEQERCSRVSRRYAASAVRPTGRPNAGNVFSRASVCAMGAASSRTARRRAQACQYRR